jgi:hypothetical protein
LRPETSTVEKQIENLLEITIYLVSQDRRP